MYQSPPGPMGAMGPPGPYGAPDASPGGAASLRSFFVQQKEGRPGATYEPMQKLGEGAFGVAHLVRDKRTGQMRVLKTINKRQSQVPPAQLEQEIKNMKACDHPHIIRLFEYYEDYENIYLVMERAAGGELHQVLQEQRRKSMQLPERWVSIVTRQSLQAIAYVHSMGIIHKDLKSENILLLHVSDVNDPSSQPHTVIIDLGIADVFHARLGRRARCTVVAGTPTHMAPEVWRGSFGQVADIWSLGVVLFELLSGELPFMCSSLNSANEWVRLSREGPNWGHLAHTSNQARALNQRMLSCDERMRPTAQQCLGHSWFKDDGPAELLTIAAGDSSEAALSGFSPRSPRLADRDLGERLRQTLHTYSGRSKFEKTVLFQVASQLHTAQVLRIGDIFAAADLNRNGLLEKPELISALMAMGAEPADAESYVTCLDADGNGHVEYTEFAAGCVGLLCESLRDMLWQSFCTIDVDGNGVLGREEVLSVVTHAELQRHGFPGGAERSVDEVLDRMDVDRNGQISFDELCRHFLPPRPDLPGYPTEGGEAFGSHSPGGAGASPERKGSPLKQMPILKDEDFAQLLDEITADREEVPHRGFEDDLGLNDLGYDGRGVDVPSPLGAAYMTFDEVYAKQDAHSGLQGASTEAFVSEMLLPSFDDPDSGVFLYESAPVSEAPVPLASAAPLGPTAVDADDELSRMLDDMMNGP